MFNLSITHKLIMVVLKAAEQFEEDKKAYMNSKDRELESVQHQMEELSLMVSEKESQVLAKELEVSELEIEGREKDRLFNGIKKEKE